MHVSIFLSTRSWILPCGYVHTYIRVIGPLGAESWPRWDSVTVSKPWRSYIYRAASMHKGLVICVDELVFCKMSSTVGEKLVRGKTGWTRRAQNTWPGLTRGRVRQHVIHLVPRSPAPPVSICETY